MHRSSGGFMSNDVAESMAARAYGHINARLGWVHLPGTRLSLDGIARDLGVSRQPVRDAVYRLQAEGSVSVVAQVGCVVAAPDPCDLDGIARLVAEADAAFLPQVMARMTSASFALLAKRLDDVDTIAAGPWHGFEDSYAARLAAHAYYDELYAVGTSRALGDAIALLRERLYKLMVLRSLDVRCDRPVEAARSELRAAFGRSADSLRRLSDALAAADVRAASDIARERIFAAVRASVGTP